MNRVNNGSFPEKEEPTENHQLVIEDTKASIEPAKVYTVQLGSHSDTVAQKAKRLLHKRLCILNWIGDYNTKWGVNDLIAGITLGLTIIPESIACALLAGLPARYGLCSAFIGPFIYLFLGSVNKVIIGPTSLMALVSVQFTAAKPIEFAFLLTFLAGVVQLIMGFLNIGFLFEFISMPVIKAFSTATAVLVIESQIKVLLDIRYVVVGLVNSVRTLVSRLDEARLGDLVMGVCAIVFLLALDLLEKISRHASVNKSVRVFCRYLSFSRNTLVVVLTASVTYVWLGWEPHVPYALSHDTMSGLPNFTVPQLTIETPEHTYSFWEIVGELNVGIVVIAIIGMITNISIGKLNPKALVDANQELLTLGLCNVLGSCVQSMPTSGAFSRYAISSACGLRTPMANLYSGIIVLLALSYISPYFNYIPKPTLAAILICSLATLLDFRLPVRLWRDSKRDFGVWLLCFVVCVLCGVEVGLLVSMMANVLHLLFLWARPEITLKIEEMDGMEYISVTPGNGIFFPAINYLRAKVLKAATRAEFKVPVVIDCHKVTGLDYTAAQGIGKLASGLCQQEDDDGAGGGAGGGTGTGGGDTLLILYRMAVPLQKLIDYADNLVFCESEEKIREFLTQEALRNGHINLKDHIRASIDLGYKIDID